MSEQLDLFTSRKLRRPKAGKARKRKTARKAPRKRKAPAKKTKKKPGIASTAAFKRGFLAGIAARSHMGAR